MRGINALIVERQGVNKCRRIEITTIFSGFMEKARTQTQFLPSPCKLDEHRPFLWRKIAKGLPEELDVRLFPSAPGVLRYRLGRYMIGR